jgi:hypothetical protein
MLQEVKYLGTMKNLLYHFTNLGYNPDTIYHNIKMKDYQNKEQIYYVYPADIEKQLQKYTQDAWDEHLSIETNTRLQ